jgi:DNA-binding MarR family transcriptional regulator
MYPDEWRSANATQRDVLIAIGRDGPQSVAELADLLGRHRTNISKATRALRDRELIERGAWSDRGYPLGLTDRGRTVVVVAADVYREAI